jgi:hypothetical protein
VWLRLWKMGAASGGGVCATGDPRPRTSRPESSRSRDVRRRCTADLEGPSRCTIVEPVLMAPLPRRWAEVRKQAEKLAKRRDAASGGRARRINNDLSSLLSRFAEEIASVRVLDPACGSGNFLSVSVHNLLNSSRLPAPTITSSACCTRGRTSCGHAGWEPGWAWATTFATHPRRVSRRSRCRGRLEMNRKAIRFGGGVGLPTGSALPS